MVAVAGLDRLGRLVGLLDEVRHQRLVGLLGVPGAAAGRAQPVHHGDEVEQPRARARPTTPTSTSTSGGSRSRDDLRGDRVGQPRVAVGRGHPDDVAVRGAVHQGAGQLGRGHVTEVRDRHTRLVDRLGERLVGVAGEHRVGGVQRLPRDAR